MLINKFKLAVQPLQMWLLKNRRCVGCGKELLKVGKVQKKSAKTDFYKCECSRVYAYDKVKKSFRRALIKEL